MIVSCARVVVAQRDGCVPQELQELLEPHTSAAMSRQQ